MIKVLLVDDQELIRDSLRIMIESDEFKIVDAVQDGEEALYAFEVYKPDVVLLDIRMPGMDGIRSLKRMKEKSPDTPVIMLTTYDDDEYIYDSLRYGASGYLLKNISPKDLKDAIRLVHRGGTLLTPDILKKTLKLFSDLANTTGLKRGLSALPEAITRNEARIIHQIGLGKANKEIAAELNFSDGTVRNYISSISQKLDVRDRTQIAIWAVQHGLHSPESGVDL